jgi:hypothetical protein
MTPHETEIQDFTLSIVSNVDLVATLRGHLYLERAMFALLRKSEPGRDAHFAAMTFAKKTRVLQAKGLVPNEAIKGIRAINFIRNEFAHQLERVELTEGDDKMVEHTMTGAMAPKFASMRKGEPNKLEGGRVRVGIVTLYAVLREADGVSIRWR